ncbi:T9SS type A sorting domain-containing protein [Dyadobacter sp. CY345]|uniref:T9SS type A sorting domain-containing protein n=1 Tax=Dyadobacter sp. CY345 TaxID=2909335 RepID=UPI001F199E5A|nr:T9SS type A sorting domain-containing protein [Dyadobacter sp. CY345]MCF2447362.1 T9SS type A sorting domain-containing protein [Dyadobacter sp. CY345]
MVPTDGTGSPTVPILVDPTIDGTPVGITFVSIDNAGKESANTGTAAITTTTPPTASNDNGTTTPGVEVLIPTLDNDTQGSASKDPTSVLLIDPADGLKKTSVTIPGEGTYTVNSTTGVVTFTPEATFNNAKSTITYTYKDINGNESNVATITVNMGPLPVTLVSFTAAKEGVTALLSWSTTMETNSERFDIEHSLSGKNWEIIGSVASHGESAQQVNYTFTHATLSIGENLYRLKMVDRDGTFAYSRIQGVKSDSNVELISYPNPVSERLMINNFGLVKDITLYSNTGQMVIHSNALTAQGIDLTKLEAGLYMVKLNLTDGRLITQKIVVIK